MENIQYLKPSLQTRQKRRDKRLDKELIECYRWGTRSKKMKGYNKKFLAKGFESAHTHESIKFMHGGGTKYFNDNLSPLKRFLERRVGKNWDKLKSELCQRMDKNKVSGLHVFNHLYDFVYENTFVENRIVYHYFFGRRQPLISTEHSPKYYVHHKTGQLMKAPYVRWRNRDTFLEKEKSRKHNEKIKTNSKELRAVSF